MARILPTMIFYLKDEYTTDSLIQGHMLIVQIPHIPKKLFHIKHVDLLYHEATFLEEMKIELLKHNILLQRMLLQLQ